MHNIILQLRFTWAWSIEASLSIFGLMCAIFCCHGNPILMPMWHKFYPKPIHFLSFMMHFWKKMLFQLKKRTRTCVKGIAKNTRVGASIEKNPHMNS